jgi:hypothetical protein
MRALIKGDVANIFLIIAQGQGQVFDFGFGDMADHKSKT